MSNRGNFKVDKTQGIVQGHTRGVMVGGDHEEESNHQFINIHRAPTVYRDNIKCWQDKGVCYFVFVYFTTTSGATQRFVNSDPKTMA